MRPNAFSFIINALRCVKVCFIILIRKLQINNSWRV